MTLNLGLVDSLTMGWGIICSTENLTRIKKKEGGVCPWTFCPHFSAWWGYLISLHFHLLDRDWCHLQCWFLSLQPEITSVYLLSSVSSWPLVECKIFQCIKSLLHVKSLLPLYRSQQILRISVYLVVGKRCNTRNRKWKQFIYLGKRSRSLIRKPHENIFQTRTGLMVSIFNFPVNLNIGLLEIY